MLFQGIKDLSLKSLQYAKEKPFMTFPIKRCIEWPQLESETNMISPKIKKVSRPLTDTR